MRTIKIVVIAIVIVLATGEGLIFSFDHLVTGLAEEVDKGYQEQRFEGMLERDRIEKIRCSKMSKKQKLEEMCP